MTPALKEADVEMLVALNQRQQDEVVFFNLMAVNSLSHHKLSTPPLNSLDLALDICGNFE